MTVAVANDSIPARSSPPEGPNILECCTCPLRSALYMIRFLVFEFSTNFLQVHRVTTEAKCGASIRTSYFRRVLKKTK